MSYLAMLGGKGSHPC